MGNTRSRKNRKRITRGRTRYRQKGGAEGSVIVICHSSGADSLMKIPDGITLVYRGGWGDSCFAPGASPMEEYEWLRGKCGEFELAGSAVSPTSSVFGPASAGGTSYPTQTRVFGSGSYFPNANLTFNNTSGTELICSPFGSQFFPRGTNINTNITLSDYLNNLKQRLWSRGVTSAYVQLICCLNNTAPEILYAATYQQPLPSPPPSPTGSWAPSPMSQYPTHVNMSPPPGWGSPHSSVSEMNPEY